nr:hypothetical protein [Tanacetum cinerariifolium]
MEVKEDDEMEAEIDDVVDDAEIIHPYKEADPLNKPPPDSNTGPEAVAISPASTGHATLHPLGIYVGDGSSSTTFTADHYKFYAPGPLGCNIEALHSKVKTLAKQIVTKLSDQFQKYRKEEDVQAENKELRKMLRSSQERVDYHHETTEYHHEDDDEDEMEVKEDDEMEAEIDDVVDDAEIIHPYKEADPLNKPPPDSNTGPEAVAVSLASTGHATLHPLGIYVGDGSSSTTFTADHYKVYAPGPLGCNIEALHSKVKTLAKQIVTKLSDQFQKYRKEEDVQAENKELRKMLRSSQERVDYHHETTEYHRYRFTRVSYDPNAVARGAATDLARGVVDEDDSNDP